MCFCVYVFLSDFVVLYYLITRINVVTSTATTSFVILVTVILLLRLCLRAADGSYLSCQFYYLCACFV